MTENQIRYNINAKRSRALCREMERKLEEADFFERIGHHSEAETYRYRLDDIRWELDKIWDEQIELNEKIIKEIKLKRKLRYANLELSSLRMKGKIGMPAKADTERNY